MMKRWIGTGMLLLVVSMAIMAQGNRTQKVLGRVTDIHGNPLADVSLSIVNAEPSITQTTDKVGRFELQVPLGRQVLRASSVGYQDKEISLLLVMGEEVSLDVKLESATYNLKGVEVKRYYNKARPIQPLAYAGARSFSVEETERYAGSLGDPSRMVRSFAGVMPINDSRNEIVVRGNSSLGVQYRLDGIEIPNPNHFNAGLGMTAGQVTALNMNVVTNSDFLLGGWQATKGNALAAIFDLNLRKGNPNNHQMRFQMGYNGAELMTEGPMIKDGSMTYLASYRYSIPELASYAMKIFGKSMAVVPRYQDLTTKIDWCIHEGHTLSLIGIVGTSSIHLKTSELSGVGTTVQVDNLSFDQKVNLRSGLALLGMVYHGQLAARTDLHATLSWNYNDIKMRVYNKELANQEDFKMIFTDLTKEHKLSFSADIRHRLSTHHDNLYVGTVVDQYFLNMFNEVEDIPYPLNDDTSTLSLYRAYAQYQHLFSDAFTVTAGVHGSYLPLNGNYALEPRAAAELKLGTHHTIGLAGGLYSQLPPHTFFFVREADGHYSDSNHHLGFSKSWHANLSHNYQINKDWRVHTELYYQWLFDIAAENKAYGVSLLNYGAGENSMERIAGLRNIGRGRNYGLELTVEKFFSKNYFFLMSGTLYRSRYTDPVLNHEFSTVFDGGYILNVTGGFEWPVSSKWTLFASPQLALSGGLRYTPVDEEASQAAHDQVYQYDKWYQEQMPVYFRLDTRLGGRLNGKKVSQEWGIDLINLTDRKNIAYIFYDIDKGAYVSQYHFSFFPMIVYRLHFGL